MRRRALLRASALCGTVGGVVVAGCVGRGGWCGPGETPVADLEPPDEGESVDVRGQVTETHPDGSSLVVDDGTGSVLVYVRRRYYPEVRELRKSRCVTTEGVLEEVDGDGGHDAVVSQGRLLTD